METQELWEISTNNLILLVESVRYLIVKAGGMACKSLVEEVLMSQLEIGREDAHSVTNMAEQANLRLFVVNPTIWTSYRWPEPKIEDWPYLQNFKPSVTVNPNIKGPIFRLSRQFEKVRLTYRVDRLDPAVAKEIADTYWFLVPINKAFTARQLAHVMHEYSLIEFESDVLHLADSEY